MMIIKIIGNNTKYLLKKALQLAFFISTIASIYEIAIGKIIEKDTCVIKAILYLLLAFVILYVVSFIILSLRLCFKKQFEIFSTDKHSVYLHFEDLLNNKIVNDQSKQKYIVINVNRCFDTIVNNQLISENTLHGIVFKKLYDEKKYNEMTLQTAIDNSLNDIHYINISKADKPQGNLKRYDVGSVVKIDDNNTKSYFLLAMSTFDKNLNAHTSKQDYGLAIQRLIEYCDSKSQGFPVLMPLLGSNFSRAVAAGKDCYSDTLGYLINSLKINKDIINCDFHIYILPQDKHKINFYNL